MLSANHSAYAFNNFYPSIVRGFNLGSNTITLVCTAPPYLIGALVTFAMAYNSDRINERGWHITISMTVAIIGFIISVATLNVPARYFASFLYIAGCFTGNSLVLHGVLARRVRRPRRGLARRRLSMFWDKRGISGKSFRDPLL
jgi:hypothetical protein